MTQKKRHINKKKLCNKSRICLQNKENARYEIRVRDFVAVMITWFLCRQKSSLFHSYSLCFGYVRIDGVANATVLHTYDSKQQWHMWLFIDSLLLLLSSNQRFQIEFQQNLTISVNTIWIHLKLFVSAVNCSKFHFPLLISCVGTLVTIQTLKWILNNGLKQKVFVVKFAFAIVGMPLNDEAM